VRVGSSVGVAGLALALVLGGGAWGAPAEREGPQLLIGDSVAGDFAALAGDTYGRFVAAAPGLGECVRSPRLEAVYDLEELAVYDQRTHVMSVRVPATAVSLSASLVHELAHHLELSCPSHPAMRVRFLAVQGFDPATPWFGGDVWEEIPSEQFAEAVVHVVLGGRDRHLLRMQLTPEAVDVVAEWLATGQ
jgi:hypothetical protein